MLLSAGARGLSYKTGFQYRYVGVISVGNREKNDRKKQKKRVGFSVSFFWGFWATEKNRFSVGKNREKSTEKNDFRFSVHNPGAGCLRVERTRRHHYFIGKKLKHVSCEHDRLNG